MPIFVIRSELQVVIENKGLGCAGKTMAFSMNENAVLQSLPGQRREALGPFLIVDGLEGESGNYGAG